MAPSTDNTLLHTWWHDNNQINDHAPVAEDQVRKSRKYKVSVRLVGQQEFQRSFVYESIPRDGNKKSPEVKDDDGVSVEADSKINMAWTQFQYGQDVEVRIESTDGSKLGPPSNVVIRPSIIPYVLSSPNDKTIIIQVPYDTRGRRFSVEFQNDLYTYRSDHNSYVDRGGVVVSEEPRNALLIFASPFIPQNLIPPQYFSGTQIFNPGVITESMIVAKPILYFRAGVYWVKNKEGGCGKSHIRLHPDTHYVYMEPGTYIKGAFEYTTPNLDFYTVGHGVISGEHYAPMANKDKEYAAIKDDGSSLRMLSHYSVQDCQTWHCIGPTINAPPFNSVDLFPKYNTGYEEHNKVRQNISDYKQVGAFYFQTDGPQIYAGTVKDCFWHVNDDAIKLYHSGATIQNIVVWKCHNDPVIQMGWKSRHVSDVTIDGLHIIHSRWFKSETGVPSAIIGASPFYIGESTVDKSKTISAKITNITYEGHCAALLRISPLQNYDLTVENIKMDTLLDDQGVRFGQSLIGTRIIGNGEENTIVAGQENLKLSVRIKNWCIGDKRVDFKAENWAHDKLGQLNINGCYWGQWSIE